MTDRELLCKIEGFLLSASPKGLDAAQIAVLLDLLHGTTELPQLPPYEYYTHPLLKSSASTNVSQIAKTNKTPKFIEGGWDWRA